MAYSDISSAETDPESPLTTTLMVKYVDNLLQVEQWIRDRLDDQVVSNWDAITGPAVNQESIWYDSVNNIWVITGSNQLIEWSDDDGQTWTPAAGNPWGGAENIGGVFHDGGALWACCGPDTGNRGVATSANGGVNWTMRDANMGGDAGNAITHDLSGLWVVVGNNGKISSSTDGITWVAEASGVGTNLYAVCYGNGLFVAAGANGVILTSPGGVPGALVWTARASGLGALNIWGVRWGGDKFVAVADDGEFTTSTDGTAWTNDDTGIGAGNDITAVAYDGGRWVAVANDGTVLSSSNGTAWTVRPHHSGLAVFWCVARNGAPRWMAGGPAANTLASHFDPNRNVIP